MKKTLTAIGGDLGIIIDKPILDLLGIDTDTLLEVRTDGEGLIIRPVGRSPLGAPEAFIDDDDLDLDADIRDPLANGRDPSLEDGPLPSLIPSLPDEAPVAPAMTPKEKKAQKSPPKTKRPPAAPASSVSSAPARAPELVVVHKGEEVMRYALETEQVVIGREADRVDLHLDDRALSRMHVRIEKRGAALWVKDLDSANGTYVNGQRITVAVRLEAGDKIEVGHYHLHLEGLEERALSETPVLTLDGPEGMHRFAMVGDEIVIGRSHNCDISIGHKSISRRHIRILASGAGFEVEDLGSQNGCKLNGKRLKGTAPFGPGDVVSICDFTLELGYLEEERASDDAPARPRTMLIDKSVMAGAAYVDGDHQNMRSDAGHMQVGRGEERNNTGEYAIPE